MNNKQTKNKKGFTLLELLVVITILGILLIGIIANYRGIKAKNRDVRRVKDIQVLREALTMYQIDKGTYPIYNGIITGSDPMSSALLGAGVIQQIPLDPINASPYQYSYTSSQGDTFVLKFYLETDSLADYGYPKGANQVSP